jgi:radical SAM superfamily enzyme YgiQ (UPF0313 family)
VRKKLVLIQPKFDTPKLDRNQGTLAPLGLAYVAAYTPPDWDVEIIDEQVEEARFPSADLVGISTTTGSATRAYEVALRYRARGTPTVLGGVHASMVPDESLRFGDSVVIGDAEPVWERVVHDVERGELARRYEAPIESIDGLRVPRRDLLRGKYLLGSISTSRGCPFRCTFCAIHKFYKDTCRLRPIEEVIAELQGLRQRVLFFTDGNLYGYTPDTRNRFLELCRRIEQERKAKRIRCLGWVAYASVNILEDDEALTAASRAGCKNLLIGFESVNPASLREMRKVANVSRVGRYGELIENAARHGILVTAEIVLGFDADTSETLALTRRFVRETGFDVLRLQILQPLPGTETYERLAREGRLYLTQFPEDWDRIRDNFVLGVNFELANLDAYELKHAVVEMGREFYGPLNLTRVSVRMLRRFRDPLVLAYCVVLALKARKTYRNYPLSRRAVEQEVATGREHARLAKSPTT